MSGFSAPLTGLLPLLLSSLHASASLLEHAAAAGSPQVSHG